MVGKAFAGEMVCTPEPGIWKTIVSSPLVALAERMACCSDPAPLAFVFETIKVAAMPRERLNPANIARRLSP